MSMNPDENHQITLIFSDFDKTYFFEKIRNVFDLKAIKGLEQELYLVNSKSAKVTLSAKEQIVLDYLKKGLKYGQIATKMDITVDGVRYYVKRIYKKLGVNNARQAIDIVYA